MNGGNGQWKWIAGILAALMIGSVPGWLAIFRGPTKSDFNQVQATQSAMLVRIAVLETKNDALEKSVQDARDRIILLLQAQK